MVLEVRIVTILEGEWKMLWNDLRVSSGMLAILCAGNAVLTMGMVIWACLLCNSKHSAIQLCPYDFSFLNVCIHLGNVNIM